jgi:UDP-glucose 4-epimerase
MTLCLVNNIFEKHTIDYVYHFAAYAAEGLSHFIKNFNYMNNVIGSINLINASVNYKIKCFVYASSIAVYGSNYAIAYDESLPIPEDSYGIAKYTVEQELKISKEIFDLNYIIFRMHNVFGECQNIGDKYRNVVGIFMNQVMQNRPLTIFGYGNQPRCFTYVKDIIPCIAKSIDMPEIYNLIFNLGSDDEVRVKDLAYVVMKAMDKEMNIRFVEERKEVKNIKIDHTLSKKYFGNYNLTSLEEGVNYMAKWALDNGPISSKNFDNIEILQGLPPVWLE